MFSLKNLFGKDNKEEQDSAPKLSSKPTSYVDMIVAAKRTLQGVDFKNLRNAYAASPLYSPYDLTCQDLLNTAYALMDEKKLNEALMRIDQLLGLNFLNMDGHMTAKRIHEQLGDQSAAGYHQRFLQGLVGALLSTGNGQSPASAYQPLEVREEYIILQILGLQTVSRKQSVADGKSYDVFIAKDDKGVSREVYMSIDHLKKSFNKPVLMPTSPTVTIGNQTWATANLDTAQFNNGDLIMEAKSAEEWKNAGRDKIPAWCYHNNDPAVGKELGKIYNWYAVNDPRGLSPSGWKIPNDHDWNTLVEFLGGPGVAGVKMKSTSGWNKNGQGTNESGFFGLSSGSRIYEKYDGIFTGNFTELGDSGGWWSASETGPDQARAYTCVAPTWGIAFRNGLSKAAGTYVRLIKN
jgi:uncharacterized protein (TIGR02145 family)